MVSIFVNVVSLSTSEITQFADQVKVRLISELIKGISRVLLKLLKYFNGTAISAFITPSLLVAAKNLALNLNELESVMGFLDSSLLYCNFQFFLNNYHSILLDYTSALQHQDLSYYLLLRYLFQLVIQTVNGTEFLNITFLSSLSVRIPAAFAHCPTRVMVPLISKHASL